jgi:hypothetical protein
MVVLRQFVVRVLLGFAALVVSHALFEIAHFFGWYPERQLVALVMTPPSAAAIQTVSWILFALLTIGLWAIVDYFFYRRQAMTAPQTTNQPRPKRPFSRRMAAEGIAAATTLHLDLVMDEEPLGDYDRVCAVKVTNDNEVELPKCLFKLERFSAQTSPALNLPVAIRTQNQLKQRRPGRWGLSAGEHKIVPLIFRRPNRGETYLIDETEQRYFFSANEGEIRVAAYGASTPSPLVITFGRWGTGNIVAIRGENHKVGLIDAVRDVYTRISELESPARLAEVLGKSDDDALNWVLVYIEEHAQIWGQISPSNSTQSINLQRDGFTLHIQNGQLMIRSEGHSRTLSNVMISRLDVERIKARLQKGL